MIWDRGISMVIFSCILHCSHCLCFSFFRVCVSECFFVAVVFFFFFFFFFFFWGGGGGGVGCITSLFCYAVLSVFLDL